MTFATRLVKASILKESSRCDIILAVLSGDSRRLRLRLLLLILLSQNVNFIDEILSMKRVGARARIRLSSRLIL